MAHGKTSHLEVCGGLRGEVEGEVRRGAGIVDGSGRAVGCQQVGPVS